MRDLSSVGVDVSRETSELLDHYAAKLVQWSEKINLIAPASMETIWTRHICDSAQLFGLGSPEDSWGDLGSGGGLPGIVLAIIARERVPDLQFSLVESDARKAAFLRVVSAELSLKMSIHQARAEQLSPLHCQTLSARAVAPLDKLLGYVCRHLAPSGLALLPKGRNHAAEIEAAKKLWSFDLDMVDNALGDGGKILRISHLKRNAR